jgi:ComF family protein
MNYFASAAGWMQLLGRALQAAVFPYRCLGCDTFYFPKESAYTEPETPDQASVGDQFKDLIKPFLCDQCCQTITLLESPLCRVCGMPFKSRQGENHTCGTCITSPQWFDLARSCGQYDEGLKDLIHWFKYRNLPQLAHPLGVLLAWGIKTYFNDQAIDIIVPVPLHPRRMRSRGFNQAYLLARKAMADGVYQNSCTKVPHLVKKLLVRVRATRPQTGLGRDLRRKNIRNAFKVTCKEDVKGKSVLLVDDVYTTGATVNECARILKRSGANQVVVLSLARAI